MGGKPKNKASVFDWEVELLEDKKKLFLLLSDRTLTVSEIASEMGISKSRAKQLVASLSREGLLR